MKYISLAILTMNSIMFGLVLQLVASQQFIHPASRVFCKCLIQLQQEEAIATDKCLFLCGVILEEDTYHYLHKLPILIAQKVVSI